MRRDLLSARKLGCARGGGMCIRQELYRRMRGTGAALRGLLPYGGMSVREMRSPWALEETADGSSTGPRSSSLHLVDELVKRGIPVITRPAAGCATSTRDAVHSTTSHRAPGRRAGSALIGGARGMERGTLSQAARARQQRLFRQNWCAWRAAA